MIHNYSAVKEAWEPQRRGLVRLRNDQTAKQKA